MSFSGPEPEQIPACAKNNGTIWRDGLTVPLFVLSARCRSEKPLPCTKEAPANSVEKHEKKGFFEHRRIDRDEKSHYTIT